jgi:hypothetical protein
MLLVRQFTGKTPNVITLDAWCWSPMKLNTSTNSRAGELGGKKGKRDTNNNIRTASRLWQHPPRRRPALTEKSLDFKSKSKLPHSDTQILISLISIEMSQGLAMRATPSTPFRFFTNYKAFTSKSVLSTDKKREKGNSLYAKIL